MCTNTTNRIFFSFSGLLHSSPDSLAESWFRAKLSRQQSYSSTYEESDLDLSRSLGIHALIDNMVSFISGDVGLAPAFKEPEESMSTSPQAIILAMEQQQSRAEVSDSSALTRSRTKRWLIRVSVVDFVLFFYETFLIHLWRIFIFYTVIPFQNRADSILYIFFVFSTNQLKTEICNACVSFHSV